MMGISSPKEAGMKKALLACCIMVLVCAVAYGSDYTGALDGVPYKIRVPGNWNGELLLYAHGYGYIERWDPAVQFDYSYADAAPGGALMEDALLSQGYALAGTVFSGTGWQVKEGTRELISLARLFNELVEKPRRTILIGYSMGSLIALKSAEDVPLYDGIVAGCTIGAGTSKSMDLVGDLSLAYSTLFGWPEAWGTWYDVRNDINFNRDVLPVLFAQAMEPSNIPKFEFMRVITGTPLEGFYSNPGWLFLGMFMATEARAELEARAKGPIVQNKNHVYTLDDAEKAYLLSIGFSAGQLESLLAAMNAQTTVTAAFAQRMYLAQYFDPRGDLQRPVISLHADRDGLVAAYQETVLRQTVRAAGKERKLLQVFTSAAGHCTFTPAQLLKTIKAMDFWLDTGIRPGPEFFPATDGFLQGYAPPAWPIGTK
jgi:pimeloyl-ACP methyl ester carboxylesterase